MATAAAETPPIEMLAASATKGVPVVVKTTRSLPISENPRDPAAVAAASPTEGALSLSSERLDASAAMAAAGAENLKDPAERATSITTDRYGVVAAVSEDGRAGSDGNYLG